MSAPLSNSWEAFTPPHAGATLGRFLHQLAVAFFSLTSIESIRPSLGYIITFRPPAGLCFAENRDGKQAIY